MNEYTLYPKKEEFHMILSWFHLHLRYFLFKYLLFF